MELLKDYTDAQVLELAAQPTPQPMVGEWALTAPDGRAFTADSPIRCMHAEMNARIPPLLALARIRRALIDASADRLGAGAEARNPWREAIDDALVHSGLDCLSRDDQPQEALARLIAWERQMALDPAISEEAQRLADGLEPDHAELQAWRDAHAAWAARQEYATWSTVSVWLAACEHMARARLRPRDREQ